MINISLGLTLSPALDGDGDGVVDQYAANAVQSCGAHTVAENGTCVVEATWLESVESDAYDEGVASVDITTDNQQAYDEGVASVDITTDNQQAYDSGYVLGEQDGYAQGLSVGTTEGYNSGFDEGVASVDITTDNQAAYDAGVASVDITTDNQAAYDAGVASVDITTDNQDSYDAGFTAGEASVTCITENVLDLPLPVCSPSNRDTVTFLDLNEDIQSVTLTREGQAGEFAEIVVEGTMFGCPDGAQSIFFSSILLNGEPYAFQYPREEKTNGLYGLDFYGNYLTMEVRPHVLGRFSLCGALDVPCAVARGHQHPVLRSPSVLREQSIHHGTSGSELRGVRAFHRSQCMHRRIRHLRVGFQWSPLRSIGE